MTPRSLEAVARGDSSEFHTLLPGGGHVQTLGGVIARSLLRWPFPTEDILVDVEDEIRLLLRASWQPNEPDRPAVVLIHGLEGSDEAPYLLSTGIHAYRSGWHVIRMNMRGCGDSLELCPRLYNAGLTQDLVAVSQWLSDRVSRFAVVGFSLGAGLTLLTLARHKQRLPRALVGAVAICPPLDMSRCADALESRDNWIYQRRFTRSLCASYRKRQRLSGRRYEAGRERGVETLRHFDDVITAFYGGYRDAEEYYQSVSTGPRLKAIEHRTLVLSSTNDPFIPHESVREWPRPSSVQIEIARDAGHVGFVGATKAPRWFWAGERAVSFLSDFAPFSHSS